MKKIIALVIAIVMMAAISVPAFATDAEQSMVCDSTGAFEGVVLTYTVDKAWTVTVFADIDFDEDTLTGNGAVTLAADYKLAYGTELTVTVTSANGWEMVDEANAANILPYTAKIGGTQLADGDEVIASATLAHGTPGQADFAGAEAVSNTIDFVVAPTNIAGVYVDTLTFTVAVA